MKYTMAYLILSPPTQSLSAPANAQETSSQLEVLVSQLLALQNSYPLRSAQQDCSRGSGAPVQC